MDVFSRSRFTLILLIMSSWCFYRLVGAAGNYCKISSCAPGQQTMCLYPQNGASSRCPNSKPVPLTYYEKMSILNKHNELRQKIARGEEPRGNPGPQPPASDMNWLRWDEELAQIAQRWADQCTINPHDTCRNVERFRVGQNVMKHWTTSSRSPSLVPFIEAWYDEVQLFDSRDVAAFRFNASWGHYSQLVWGGTMFVGCGRSSYMDSGFHHTRFVCNYGPAGNVITQKVYTVGKARYLA